MNTQTEKTTDFAPLVEDIIELGVASVDTLGPPGSGEANGYQPTGISED